MTAKIPGFLETPSGTTNKVWLDFLPYAKRLFAGGKEKLWDNPALFLSVYSQAQGLLKSDVLGVKINDFYTAWVESNPEVVQFWSGRKPTFALKKLLALEEPKNLILEVLSGLKNLYQDMQPLVLFVHSPQKWLQSLKEIFQRDADLTLSSDDVDSAAMYLADYLRSYSVCGLSAVVMEESKSPFLLLAEAVPLYQPILNLAHHYQWPVGIQVNVSPVDMLEFAEGIDFHLFAESDVEAMLPLWEKGAACGGGLNREFWTGQALCQLPSFRLMFGTIPPDAKPERVLERLKELR